MNRKDQGRIGLIIGREQDWPQAFMEEVERRDEGITAELVKLGGTFVSDPCPYPLIIDRMSHVIPYYRVYVKYASVHGSIVINNPIVWAADTRFLGIAIASRLGLTSPKTVVLPNKEVEGSTRPESFRNLDYPMDWEGIIDYVGVPAIFKEIRSGGRRLTTRVHSVDELIQHYDESGTRSMLLQEIIPDGDHIHCFVIGQKAVLPLHYSRDQNRYLEAVEVQDNLKTEHLIQSALAVTKAYGYDINMVEFIRRGEQLIIINATNPAPVIDKMLMTETQFDWVVNETVTLAIDRIKNPPPQRVAFNLEA